eukprot:TRINITY_DN26957_c0_g1_i16.p1 TRINITY_DN26957_c0_g1~~TRINITY_DN26957_c0_g1_i16.p1  ORF type:complete len:160 (-),score=43.71 TRINITY_DN26957_c0_g1_i16:322-801(-)
MEELNAMAEKVIEIRNNEPSNKDNRKFEMNPVDLLAGGDLSVKSTASDSFDPGLDEASYLSWIEKFKELSPSIQNSTMELGRKRNLSVTRHLKQEVHKRVEEKKLAKWEALGYKSLAVKDPICDMDGEIMSDSGSVQFVYGDCTKPSKVCPSEPAIIFR